MSRILTALVGIPLALLALFGLPSAWFFFLVFVVLGWGAVEFATAVQVKVPTASPWLLLPAVLALAMVLAPGLLEGLGWAASPAAGDPIAWLSVLAFAASIGAGMAVLFSRGPIAESLTGIAVLSFGVPYFALPIATLYHLKRVDPWLVFLLFGIVWLGDSAAYYVGSAFGRHKLAPVVSPNKSWEGASASLAVAIVMTVVWSVVRLGRLEVPLLLVCIATAIAAQLGDLVESMIKRSVGVKDSGRILPGHGGLWDRMDALLFAAPVLDLGLRWLGPSVFLP